MRGSAWSLAGYGLMNSLRLVSSLILTRLLFPEAFGLMALVQVVTRGLQMFSDIGINASIIRDKQGENREFLDTAWTLQVLRGILLWALASLAAIPAARFFEKPELAYLLPVASLTAVIHGFSSTSLFLANRRIALSKPIIIQVIGQLCVLVFTAVWAWLYPTVWAIVFGGLFGAAIRLVLSYTLFDDSRNRFHWDKKAFDKIFQFGKWIFLSTAITFLLQQGDRAVFGKLMSSADLGVYSIAILLARSATEAALRLNAQVLFPLYAKMHRSSADELWAKVRITRLGLLACLLPPTWIFAVFGEPIVAFFWDPRYEAAGWMLRILSVGTAGTVVTMTTGSVLMAAGDSYRLMILQVARGVLLILGMVIGGHLGGIPGILAGMAVAKYVEYPLDAWAVRKHNMWMFDIDFAAFTCSGLIIGLGYWLV